MRIATKNEVIVLLGDKAMGFAQFCLSPEGATFKFLFDNTTNFDLDESLVQGMLAQLLAANIIDQACVNRFNSFGSVMPPEDNLRTYQLAVPPNCETIAEYAAYVSPFLVLPDGNPKGLFISELGTFQTDGVCTHPDAVEVV